MKITTSATSPGWTYVLYDFRCTAGGYLFIWRRDTKRVAVLLVAAAMVFVLLAYGCTQ